MVRPPRGTPPGSSQKRLAPEVLVQIHLDVTNEAFSAREELIDRLDQLRMTLHLLFEERKIRQDDQILIICGRLGSG